jgi:hypothetical protein
MTFGQKDLPRAQNQNKIKLLFESMLAVNLFKPIEKKLTTASEDCPTERTNLPVKG